ncbi:MAG: phosphatidylglycerol lysyltransferase domain-containing protein [Gemmatimonadales bacterium]
MIASGTDELARVRELVLAYGWNSTAYQIVNPGIAHWFSAGGDAVAGLVDCGAVWMVAGAPVAPEARLETVVRELESDAAQRGASVCYLAAEGRLERLLRGRPGCAFVTLGAQPCWRPAAWPRIVAAHGSLRAQLFRARNKGVVVSRWGASRAHDHPALRACLTEWLARRGLPPLHFMTTPFTLGRILDRMVLVAERDGRVIGFLVASPVPARRGWLVEQIVRGAAAPNGTAELLVDAAFTAMIAAGSEYITLGLAPLSTRAGVSDVVDPWWLRWMLRWARAHGRRFYNFDGLDRFKAKFDPEWWDPMFAVTNQPTFRPRTLYAVAQAFSANAPVALALSGLARAVRQELAWIVGGRSGQRSDGRTRQSTKASGRT